MAWWLTVTKHRAECGYCRGEVSGGEPIAFRPAGSVVLCLDCAEKQELDLHPSKRYREWRERELQLTLV